jgi:hypothetical protein
VHVHRLHEAMLLALDIGLMSFAGAISFVK